MGYRNQSGYQQQGQSGGQQQQQRAQPPPQQKFTGNQYQGKNQQPSRPPVRNPGNARGPNHNQPAAGGRIFALQEEGGYDPSSITEASRIKEILKDFTKEFDEETLISDRLRGYAQKLEAIGYHVDDDDLVFYALKGLPPEFKPVRSALIAKGDVVFDELVTILKNEELQLERDEGFGSTKVFLTTQSSAHEAARSGTQMMNHPQVMRSGILGHVPQYHQAPMYQNSHDTNAFFPAQTSGNINFGGSHRQKGGRGSYGQNNKIECQICGKTNHTAMYCYHRQNLQYQPPSNNFSYQGQGSRRSQSWNGSQNTQGWNSQNWNRSQRLSPSGDGNHFASGGPGAYPAQQQTLNVVPQQPQANFLTYNSGYMTPSQSYNASTGYSTPLNALVVTTPSAAGHGQYGQTSGGSQALVATTPSAAGHGLSKGDFCALDGRSVQRKFKEVSWTKPKPSCFKLNTDGASKGNPGASSCGGIIRDSEGKWIYGFHRNMGYATSLKAELWALRDGLVIATHVGFLENKLEVEVDATAVLKLIDDRDDDNIHGDLKKVVADCRLLLEKLGLTTPNHVYREANQCADILANVHNVDEGISLDGLTVYIHEGDEEDISLDGLTVFENAPSCVEDKRLADASGGVYRRFLYE
ncbi:hypothetical protein Vadar_030567 [Vaccinium darrowii]|uniref:Uncharacterized protein n=1 Tax=Vaccinium darrowii TaxID=229202 RepID=A0ACB7XVV1_9ERIC|nr:hypothetical protein Vadar_030567 [Vaccinium darrowii]